VRGLGRVRVLRAGGCWRGAGGSGLLAELLGAGCWLLLLAADCWLLVAGC